MVLLKKGNRREILRLRPRVYKRRIAMRKRVVRTSEINALCVMEPQRKSYGLRYS